MVSFRPLSKVMGPLPNGRTLWLINGGDPNHLRYLGWTSKDLGPKKSGAKVLFLKNLQNHQVTEFFQNISQGFHEYLHPKKVMVATYIGDGCHLYRWWLGKMMETDAIWRDVFFKWVVITHQLDWGKALWKPTVGAGKGDSGDDREFFVTWT